MFHQFAAVRGERFQELDFLSRRERTRVAVQRHADGIPLDEFHPDVSGACRNPGGQPSELHDHSAVMTCHQCYDALYRNAVSASSTV